MKFFMPLACFFASPVIWLAKFTYFSFIDCTVSFMDKYMKVMFSQSEKWKVSFRWPFTKPEPFRLWRWYNFF